MLKSFLYRALRSFKLRILNIPLSECEVSIDRVDIIDQLSRHGCSPEIYRRILGHYAAHYASYPPIKIGDFKIFSGDDYRPSLEAVNQILSAVYQSVDERINFLKNFELYEPEANGINPTNERVCTLLTAYYLFKEKRDDECLEVLNKAIRINSMCLLANYMYGKIRRRRNDVREEEISNSFCSRPFEQAWVINEGEVYLCCPVHMPISIGNAYTQTWEEIWNSDIAQEIRASILNGSYKYCNRYYCPYIVDYPPQKAINYAGTPYEEIIANKTTKLPKEHKLAIAGVAYDYTCNLCCPSCRREYYKLDDKQAKKIQHAKELVTLPLMKQAKSFHISGGDPFASHHSKDLLGRINPAEFPSLSILEISTNGVLFDQKQWERLANLHYLDIKVYLSVDAATEQTYNIVRRGGDWQRLNSNLKFIAKLRKENKIKVFNINFCVQDHNFKEMIEFLKLGLSLNVDTVYFQKIYNSTAFTADEFTQRTVFNPSHPQYSEFIEILRNPIFIENRDHVGFVSFESDFEAAGVSKSNFSANDDMFNIL